MITQEYIKSILHYNPETGVFTWLEDVNPRARKGMIAGGLSGSGYILISINNYRTGAHRLAFLYILGYIPEMVDHIDRNPQNNSWDNLRVCTSKTNAYNAGLRTDNKSGYKGITWDRSRGKWFVCLSVNSKTIGLGRYKDIEDAIRAYNKGAKKHHKEFAYIN